MMVLVFFVLIGLAILRILYLTRDSAIDAIAEVVCFPARLLADIRRNGVDVLRAIGGWLLVIALMLLVSAVGFAIFVAFLCLVALLWRLLF